MRSSDIHSGIPNPQVFGGLELVLMDATYCERRSVVIARDARAIFPTERTKCSQLKEGPSPFPLTIGDLQMAGLTWA